MPKTDSLRKFMSKFAFNPELAFNLGVEQECFIEDARGNIIAAAPRILKRLDDPRQFSYELSSCQLEHKVGPVVFEDLPMVLLEQDVLLREKGREFAFRRLYVPVAPENMPYDIYPDERYLEKTEELPEKVVKAACRTAATQINIGMPDHAITLWIYNYIVKYVQNLCALGGKENEERLQLIDFIVGGYMPPLYRNWAEFYERAVKEGFEENPKDCWDIFRISAKGTLEFRMFPSTNDRSKIVEWGRICLELCLDAFEEYKNIRIMHLNAVAADPEKNSEPC